MTLLIMAMNVFLQGNGELQKELYASRELAAELAATLSFSAVKNKDKVGLLIYTDQIELYIPPPQGTTARFAPD